MAETPRQRMGRAFVSLEREHGFEPLVIEGDMPRELEGTLYRNGPAIFESFDLKYDHWFDGDGAISAVRFSKGKADGAVRVTEGKELLEERAAGRALYSSGFTKGPVWWRRLGARAKNTASINVLWWQRRLFALPELAKPYEIDPKTLRTKGVSDLDGVLHDSIQAHFRVEPETGDIWAFALKMGMRMAIAIYVLPVEGAGRHVADVPLERMSMFIHDYAMSEEHLVFMVHPVGLSMMPVLLGTVAPPEAIRWEPEHGSEIIVVPKRDPERVTRVKCDAFFHTHCANAFDEGRRVAVDFSRYPNFVLGDAFTLERLRSGTSFDDLADASLTRAWIDLDAETLEVAPIADGLIDFACTAPSRQGRRARFLFALETQPQRDVLVKLDLESGERRNCELGDGMFPGEGTFVPNGDGEDGGHLLTMVYDADRHRSGVAVIDAPTLEQRAWAWFGHHIPPPIHGCWVAAQ